MEPAGGKLIFFSSDIFQSADGRGFKLGIYLFYGIIIFKRFDVGLICSLYERQ